MLKKFSFWIWGAIITQLLTAVFHSLSFFMKPEPQNETEKELLDLTSNYKPDSGMGFHPSFADLFTGASIIQYSSFFFVLSTPASTKTYPFMTLPVKSIGMHPSFSITSS